MALLIFGNTRISLWFSSLQERVNLGGKNFVSNYGGLPTGLKTTSTKSCPLSKNTALWFEGNTQLLLQNAKAVARMVSDWSECFIGEVCIAFVLVLDTNLKGCKLNREVSKIQKHRHAPPPADWRWANVRYAFLLRQYSNWLLESKLPLLTKRIPKINDLFRWYRFMSSVGIPKRHGKLHCL